MFPTFISILDIQSWWEVPSIAHFCSLFRTAFNLLDFDIEDLEEALLTDGTEETSWLQELIVRLLSGCLPNNEISTFNYQMFLRRLFRQKCQEHDQYNPFNTDCDFQLLPLRTKVDILHALCDFRLDADDVLDQLKNLEADSLRVEPLGYDGNDSAYWYFYGTRLYREDFKTKNQKKKSVWQVICFTEDDWFQLNKKFKKSTSKCERQLHRTLTDNFLPELPRLFREKERLARKRLLENQPRRSSRRLRKEENVDVDKAEPQESSGKRRNNEDDESHSERSESRYEMGGAKARQKKSRQRKLSTSSNTSKDANKGTKRKKSDEAKSSSSSATPTTVGRQTNNSLAAATGQIVIQSVANPHKKKLKTSQVFRQTDEDLITGMHKILDCVKNHEDAWPFVDPVDEDYAPNYYSVIRKPMDLQRMEDRLDAGYYKNFSKFRDDFQLIVDNCRLYNGAENEYTEMVDNLLKVFERATEKFLDQISSSDDEIAVEFPDLEGKDGGGKRKETSGKPSKRKPTLVAKTDKKRERSRSDNDDDDEEEKKEKQKVIPPPRQRSLSVDSFTAGDDSKIKTVKQKDKDKSGSKKSSSSVIVKKDKLDTKKTIKDKKNSRANSKNNKKEKSKVARSPSRSPFRRGYSSSPPPSSSAPSSPDNRFDFVPKKQKTHQNSKAGQDTGTVKGKVKTTKQDRFKGLFDADDSNDSSKFSPKKQPIKAPTPEKSTMLPAKPKDKHNKLRETIEKLKAKSISNKLINDDEYRFDLDTPKENKLEKSHNRKDDNTTKSTKTKKEKLNKQKRELDSDSNTQESVSDTKKAKKPGRNSTKNAAIEALTIATAETLKDINKWLDDTPKSPPEFSSVSNSPSYAAAEYDFDANKERKAAPTPPKPVKDVKRRNLHRDPAKFLKRREIQRTIDRLQPGKSKGNLITNVQSAKKEDELFPLGPLSKQKDSKNALIVKPDDNAPKLSLGTVLDNFGKHKFVEDVKKEEEEKAEDIKEEVPVVEEKKEVVVAEESSSMMSGATPNLSAWFKAFGAPKSSNSSSTNSTTTTTTTTPSIAPKKAEIKEKEIEKPPVVVEEDPKEVLPVIPAEVPRQRRVSTGSSVSERSSFSQDMDSPRDERLGGACPAPYPSPLHRSPSSPRADASPRAYPPFNGQIRVGFYQDTVSNKSSPEKSSSSPHHFDHVYPPPTTTAAPPATVAPPAYSSYPPAPYYSGYENPQPPAYYEQEHYEQEKVFPVKKRAATFAKFEEEQQQQQQQPPQQPTYTANNYEASYPLRPQQYQYGYARPPQQPQPQPPPQERYNANALHNLCYKGMEMTPNPQQQQQPQPQPQPQQQQQQMYNAPEPHRPYNAHLEMGNIANLTHIVDRYNSDDRIMGQSGAGGQYYDKGGAGVATGMFNKQAPTMPSFNQNMGGMQQYNQGIQQQYSRQMGELQQNLNVDKGMVVGGTGGGQQQTQHKVVQEKKTKKRKNNKNAQVSAAPLPVETVPPPTSQGFHSYTGLKSPLTSSTTSGNEPSAISLKTASVVPGSAFNFGPAAPGLGIGSGLYGDKDAYPNFLEDFRPAPNYYYRPEMGTDKQTRQPPAPSYPFIGAPQPRPPNWGSPFMPSAAQVMDAGAPPPLYPHYLHSGVLNQGLLAPAAYPPGYLSMRQPPYDSMTRPPWL